MSRFMRWFSGALLILTVTGLAWSAPPQKLTLQFGIYQTDTATEMFRSFSPVTDAVARDLSQRLGYPVEIELMIFKTYDEGLDALVTGKVDFVRFGAASYVLCRQLNKGIQLLAMELKNGKKYFNGVIVVGAQSPITKLGDLQGKSFAFGNINSTIGRFLSQSLLLDAGVTADKLRSFDYLGRHDLVAKAVQMGDFDAGALKERTFKKANTDGSLRVLTSFKVSTKPWIAKQSLADDIVSALRETLLALSEPAALKPLKISGFTEGSDSDYEYIRMSMIKAREFGD